MKVIIKSNIMASICNLQFTILEEVQLGLPDEEKSINGKREISQRHDPNVVVDINHLLYPSFKSFFHTKTHKSIIIKSQ